MSDIIDKLVAIRADRLEEAKAWIDQNCGTYNVVMPLPVGAWARIVFRSKCDGFMWRMRSGGGWSKDGSRAAAVLSGNLDYVEMLLCNAQDDLRHIYIDAWIQHWLIAKCEFTGDEVAAEFAREFGAGLLG